MKTEQEQIKAIKQIIDERVETTLGQVQGRHGNVIKTVDTVIIARDIVDAGYGDVSAYKAEIEQLKTETSNIRKDTAKEFATRICEMLWNLGVDEDGNRFSYGDLTSKNVLYVAKQFGVDIDDRLCKENNIATSHLERIIEQNVKIERLKIDYSILQEQFAQYLIASYEDVMAQRKQAKIDILNKLKEEMGDVKVAAWTATQIDELIKEIENGKCNS